MNPNSMNSLVASLLWVSIISNCISVYLHNCIIYRCSWKSLLHIGIVFLVFQCIHKYTIHQYFIQFSWISTPYSINVLHWKSLLCSFNIQKCTVPMFHTGTVFMFVKAPWGNVQSLSICMSKLHIVVPLSIDMVLIRTAYHRSSGGLNVPSLWKVILKNVDWIFFKSKDIF